MIMSKVKPNSFQKKHHYYQKQQQQQQQQNGWILLKLYSTSFLLLLFLTIDPNTTTLNGFVPVPKVVVSTNVVVTKQQQQQQQQQLTNEQQQKAPPFVRSSSIQKSHKSKWFATVADNNNKKTNTKGIVSSLSSRRSLSSSSSSGALNAAVSSVTTSSKSQSQFSSPYPTQRGETVDSRQIMKSSKQSQHLMAVRIKHLLLVTQEMADYCVLQMKSTTTTIGTTIPLVVPVSSSSIPFNSTTSSTSTTSNHFQQLVEQLSVCSYTKDKGGEIGWISTQQPKQQQQQSSGMMTTKRIPTIIQTDDIIKTSSTTAVDGTTTTSANSSRSGSVIMNIIPSTTELVIDMDPNEHLNVILPREARDLLLQITTKPGDVVTVPSSLGYHVIQIMDVMVDVQKMAYTRQRKNTNKQEDADITFNWFDTAHELTYKMETMGCQMNMADSERIEGQLQNLGIRPFIDLNDTIEIDEVESNQQQSLSRRKRNKNKIEQKPPDIIILNTCSIRDHAEQKVYSYLGPYAKRKRAGEDVTIIVAGCVAQQEGIQLLRKVPEIDLVMGPQYANRIGDLLEQVRMYGRHQMVATEPVHIMEDSTQPRRSSTVCAWVNIIYGCNERCTFCIVPTTRGIEQSRPMESIVSEIHDLVQNQGYKEITLLGQNIDAYGRDMVPKRKFSDLLRTIEQISGLQRVRFVTSHPRYMSMGVIDAVADCTTLCEAFHIPFQSGSNDILTLMGRGHTREKYLRIVDRIRSRIPDAAITADVIVGFPGETEKDFQDTLDLMETVIFDSVNTAAYSPRPNTPAANWENQIDEEVKQERLQRINELNKVHAYQRRSRLLNQMVEVLVEERNVQRPEQVMGRTRHGYIVYLNGNIDELRGELVNVRIERTETYYLTGTRVS